ncbi:hypothetical protein RSAG8_03889, partial [Rhizoctonia solani AG-8 WAC10335]
MWGYGRHASGLAGCAYCVRATGANRKGAWLGSYFSKREYPGYTRPRLCYSPMTGSAFTWYKCKSSPPRYGLLW